jgi:hypothetical protein
MKLWKRRIFLTIAFSLFFVIAPVLVFYAIGYRYDFKNNAFKKIGMLIIESKPNNADIFLNDQHKEQSPKRIKNLVPDEYDVKVEKENYIPWKKKMSVESKSVTWASNIKLFLKNPEITFLPSVELDSFSSSPNKKLIIGISSDSKNFGLWLNNPKSEDTIKLFPISVENFAISKNDYKNLSISDIKWSPDNKKIIFSLKNKLNGSLKYFLLDINRPENIISLNNSFNFEIKNIKWNNNSDTIYFISRNNLYFIDINTKTISKPLVKDVIDYDLESNNIIYTTKEKKEILLIKTSKNEGEKKVLMHLPEDEIFIFKSGKQGNVAILFKNKKKLYLIDGESDTPKLINENTKNFKWSEGKKKLLYFSENEVWFYAPKDKAEEVYSGYKYNESNLLTRYSTEIKEVLWYPDEEYITITLEDSIKIIELDERDKRNLFELGDEIKPLSFYIEFDKKGEYLYMIDKKTKGLLKIKITDI